MEEEQEEEEEEEEAKAEEEGWRCLEPAELAGQEVVRKRG